MCMYDALLNLMQKVRQIKDIAEFWGEILQKEREIKMFEGYEQCS